MHIMDNAESHVRPESRNFLHAKYFVVVQSSGMGKSRTVAEAARKRFAIVYTLREDKPGGYSFPDSDKAIWEFLIEPRSDNDGRAMGLAFLIASFERMTSCLKAQGIQKPEDWNEWLEHNRRTFCQGVIERASDVGTATHVLTRLMRLASLHLSISACSGSHKR